MMPTFVEAALRSLLVAAMVGAGLRALRVRNVLVQKAAWGAVLAAALAMPLLMPAAARWQLLPGATLRLPAHPLESLRALLPAHAAAVAPVVADRTTASAVRVDDAALPAAPAHENAIAAQAADTSRVPINMGAAAYDSRATLDAPAGETAPPARAGMDLGEATMLLYLLVAGALFFRLLYGLIAAVDVWLEAVPIWNDELPAFAAGLKLRASRRVASPVTIGSGIVLPEDFMTWETEKLRIVLAHERSHIRQKDFYLQLIAGLYAAVVWFSPLGWWIKAKLSDLAEAISDRAGLDEAASRTSYAQLLLEFAAAPRPTPIGVAMARPHSLTRRIERLLNDAAFRQSFAGSRRALVVALVLPAALMISTALVRVEAAGQDAVPVAPAAAQSATQPVAPAEPAVVPDTPADPDVAPDPQAAPEPASMAAVPPTLQAPEAAPAPPTPPDPQETLSQGRGYSYHYGSDGDSYAVITGNGRTHMTFSGEMHTGEIDKARAQAHGDFLWFSHDGKSYIVDDPYVVAQIQAMYKSIEELGRQQEELGRQQEELGRQQEALGRKQEQMEITVPDLSKQKAEIDAAMATLQAKIGKQITQQELGNLQQKLAELEGKLGALDGQIGARQGELGSQQGKLGEMQGRLGAEQGKLGAQEGKLAEQADRSVHGIIAQSLQNGKARPVQ